MSLFAKILEQRVAKILTGPWQRRVGRVVPDPVAVALLGGAVQLDAAVLYADLARSSHLAAEFDERVVAKVVKSFLECTALLIVRQKGRVTSFDGDRVMGVFAGQDGCASAVECALNINWTVSQVVLPRVKDQFESLEKAGYFMSHAVGIDFGKILAVRAGYHEKNDLVWIGRAPNLAAKLSDIRHPPYTTFVTGDALRQCPRSSWFGGDPPACMWEELGYEWLGETIPIFASCWYRMP